MHVRNLINSLKIAANLLRGGQKICRRFLLVKNSIEVGLHRNTYSYQLVSNTANEITSLQNEGFHSLYSIVIT